MIHAPVVLFAYRKFENLCACVNSLLRNSLAVETDLIIFSDGPKNVQESVQIAKVRAYLHSVTGFRTVTVHESQVNKGLAESIIQGVSHVFRTYEKLIVIEDDLVVASNFLQYMNEALDCYEEEKKVFSISGYSFNIQPPPAYPFDVYFTRRASSWGWATWRDRWKGVDWEVSNFTSFSADTRAKVKFNEMGSDLFSMLQKQRQGRIDSWAIRWVYHQFQNDMFTVYPVRSKVLNKGFNKSATNTTGQYARFATKLDETNAQSFRFTRAIKLEPYFIHQFISKFSLQARISSRVINFLYEMVRKVTQASRANHQKDGQTILTDASLFVLLIESFLNC